MPSAVFAYAAKQAWQEMPHEFRNLPNASHETLTTALIAGGAAALVLLILIGYLVWRDRKLKKSGRTNRGPPNRPRKRRRR